MQSQEINAPALLANCPFCDYSLEGLPIEHRCPECGRPVDRRWRIFGGRSRWESMRAKGHAGTAAGVAGAILVAVPFLWLLWVGLTAPPHRLSLAVLLFFVGLFVNVRELRRRLPIFVCAGPESVVLADRRKGELARHRFASVSGAKVRSGALILTVDGAGRLLAHGTMLTSEMVRCAAYINALVATKPPTGGTGA